MKREKEKSRPAGVGLVGAGTEARRIARGYSEAGFDITAVWDPDPEACAALDAELDDCTAYESLERLLADPRVHGVEITTPLDRRAHDAAEAIIAGVAASVRAPVAATVEDATRLSETIRQHESKFRYFDPVHHHAPHALARKLALKEEIGYLNGIRIKTACADIGPILQAGIEEPLDRLALAQWFLGRAVEVETMRNESASVTIVRFEKPHRFGNFEAVQCPELSVPFSERPWDESIEIGGTTGIIWVNGFWGAIADRAPVVMRRFKRMVSFGADIIVDPRAAYRRAAMSFVRALQNGDAPSPGINEALADVKLLVAAAKSATDGGRVRIE